jgi:hypothetical protein
MQISRIRLSDKASRLHPRHVVPEPTQAYEPEVPVEVREWIGPAPASPDLVLGTQPPAQPHSVAVERAIRFADGANAEVVGPSASRSRVVTRLYCVAPHTGHLKPLGQRDAITIARHCSSVPYRRSNSGSLRPFWNCTTLRAIAATS